MYAFLEKIDDKQSSYLSQVKENRYEKRAVSLDRVECQFGAFGLLYCQGEPSSKTLLLVDSGLIEKLTVLKSSVYYLCPTAPLSNYNLYLYLATISYANNPALLVY